MNVSQNFALPLAAIVLLAVSSISSYGQNEPSKAQRPGIAVSIVMEKDKVPVGQMPMAILTVKNLTDQEIVIHNSMYQAYVEGDKGEAPTTLEQRRLTHRLRPGEADLRGDEMVIWTLRPGESGVRRFQLGYLYHLNSPGKYKVYIEVVDPTTRKPLRTKSVTFEIVAPDK